MKKSRLLALVMALVMLATMPFTALAASKTLYVRKGIRLNVRSAMEIKNGNVLTKISGGTKVTQLSTKNGWSYIKLSSGLKGYVKSSYLVSATGDPLPAGYKYVKTSQRTGVNMRYGPSMGYGVIKVVRDGQKVQVISTSRGWSKVIYNGKTGYIYSTYLSSSK